MPQDLVDVFSAYYERLTADSVDFGPLCSTTSRCNIVQMHICKVIWLLAGRLRSPVLLNTLSVREYIAEQIASKWARVCREVMWFYNMIGIWCW